MDRLRIGTIWLGGCSGCHMSFLDLDEFLIEIADKIDVVFSPVVDSKDYPEDVDVCLIEGALCNEENVEWLKKIRQRTKAIVAFGDCAVTGNVPTMRNALGLANDVNVLDRAYRECADDNQSIPDEEGIVPRLLERVVPLHEVVHVDVFLPGCPPPAERIKALLVQVLEEKITGLTGKDLKFG